MPILPSPAPARALQHRFQPLVSIKKYAVVGLEALLQETEASALDPGRALQDYAQLTGRPERGMLFLNLGADTLVSGQWTATNLQRLSQEAGLQPNDLALELGSIAAARVPGLRAMVETLQSYGFSVVLQDLTANAEDLELLLRLKPNLIKTPTSLLQGAEEDPVRQEQLKSLFSLAHRQGALGIADGVEREEQASLALELGADLLQGPLYGRAMSPAHWLLAPVKASVDRSAARYKAGLAGRWQARRRENQRHLDLQQRVLETLSSSSLDGYEGVLTGFVNAVASLECLYVLDRQGRQLTPTALWQHGRSTVQSSLFAPAQAGTDHSLKDYYLGLQLSERDRFVSEPYVSLASGNLCRTLASHFRDAEGSEGILCMDIRSL